MEYILIFTIAYLVNLPMRHMSLSEDDGTWFYLPKFYGQGVRQFIQFHIHGYFNFSFFVNLGCLIFKRTDPVFFQHCKITTLALGAVAIQFLTVTLSQSIWAGLLAAIFFICCTVTHKTLFHLTYGEYLQITHLCLSLSCIILATENNSILYACLAGVFASLALHSKPTAWIFVIPAPLLFLEHQNWWFFGLIYASTLLFILFLPLVWLWNKTYAGQAKTAHKHYLSIMLSYWQQGFKQLNILFFQPFLHKFNSLCQRKASKSTPNTPPQVTDQAQPILEEPIPSTPQSLSYTDILTKKYGQQRWVSLKYWTLPSLKDLWLIVGLSLIAMLWGIFTLNTTVFILMTYAGLMFLAQYLQQNYYTPHFNPIWPPLCILAGIFTATAATNTWLLVILIPCLGVFFWQRLKEIQLNFKQNRTHIQFLLAQAIGTSLAKKITPPESLYIFGNCPSISIYANCRLPNDQLFFTYDKQDQLANLTDITYTLKFMPADWIVFYSKPKDDWNIHKFMQHTGLVYSSVEIPINAEFLEVLPLHGIYDKKFTVYCLDKSSAEAQFFDIVNHYMSKQDYNGALYYTPYLNSEQKKIITEFLHMCVNIRPQFNTEVWSEEKSRLQNTKFALPKINSNSQHEQNIQNITLMLQKNDNNLDYVEIYNTLYKKYKQNSIKHYLQSKLNNLDKNEKQIIIYLLANYYLEIGAFALTSKYIEQLTESEQDIKVVLLKAMLAKSKNENIEFSQYLGQALSLNPNNFAALKLAALFFAQIGQWDRAEDLAKRYALQWTPENI